MSDEQQLQTALERIAKMEHAGVSHDQIAAACGIDLANLTTLMDKDKFKVVLAKIAGEAFDKFDTLNQGWDMVESTAINHVFDHLERAPDPDFALKAAALANKAQRRGRHQNNPINVQPNSQAIIQVSVSFAEKLGHTFNVATGVEKRELKKKDDNFLAPKEVHTLLQHVQPRNLETDIEAELGDFCPA